MFTNNNPMRLSVFNRSRLRPSSINGHGVFLLAWSALAGSLCGCQQPSKPIFPEPTPPLLWPNAPNPPRVRYVGMLRSSADLNPPRGAFAALTDALVGAKKPEGLYGPRSVVCTPDGSRIWVADPGGRCLHLFDLTTRAYKKIRQCGKSFLLSPVDVCLGPQESLYVCDSEAPAIHRIAARDGALVQTLRLPEELLRPVAVYYDASTDELLVVDVVAHDVKVLSREGDLRRILGRRGSGPGEFNFPCDVTADEDSIWVADTGNHRVQAVTRTGEPIVAFGQVGDAPGDLALPKGIAIDPDGHVYVVDGRFENVQIFDRTGHLLLFFGEEGAKAGEFWLPGGIFIEPTGRIWVCDSYNKRVQVFDYLRESINNAENK